MFKSPAPLKEECGWWDFGNRCRKCSAEGFPRAKCEETDNVIIWTRRALSGERFDGR